MPTYGNQNYDGSGGQWGAFNCYLLGNFENGDISDLSEAAELQTFHFHAKVANSTTVVGHVYEINESIVDDSVLVGSSSQEAITGGDSVATWHSFPFTGLTLDAGKKYALCLQVNTTPEFSLLMSWKSAGLSARDNGWISASCYTPPDPRGAMTQRAIIFPFYITYQVPVPEPAGKIYLMRGWHVGNVEIRDESFQAEIRGVADHLQNKLTEMHTPQCRASLGDARCGVDLADSAQTFWHSGSVTTVVENRLKFRDSSVPSGTPDGAFDFGLLTWSTPESGDSYTGNNAGFQMEVKTFDVATGEFELFQEMPYDIELGDEFTVQYGCDKKLATCRDRFDNVVNFRGEPFIPGWDQTVDIKAPWS